MKITEAMADAAEKRGRKVNTMPKIKKPGTKKAAPPPPAPAPAADFGPVQASISEMVESLREQTKSLQAALQESQRQNDELRAVVAAAMTEKPVRIKPVRDMDPNSRTHLLIQHIDVIPVTYRKLN